MVNMPEKESFVILDEQRIPANHIAIRHLLNTICFMMTFCMKI